MSLHVATGQMDEPPPGDLPIEALELGVRAYNTLKRAGINTVTEIFALDRASLLAVRNLGQRGYDDLRAQLIAHGQMRADAPRGPFTDEAE